MKPSYELSEENVARQVSDIQARLARLVEGLTAGQLNWQPDNGLRWSIGQCLDHVTKSAEVYSVPIADAVAASPAMPSTAAHPNLLGRAFIWFIEPPPRFKTPAPKSAKPASSFDPDAVRAEFERGVKALHALAILSVKTGSGRARFANPFAGDRRVFNVATGIMVMLAHARRHLLQAEKVKGRPDFPSA